MRIFDVFSPITTIQSRSGPNDIDGGWVGGIPSVQHSRARGSGTAKGTEHRGTEIKTGHRGKERQTLRSVSLFLTPKILWYTSETLIISTGMGRENFCITDLIASSISWVCARRSSSTSTTFAWASPGSLSSAFFNRRRSDFKNVAPSSLRSKRSVSTSWPGRAVGMNWLVHLCSCFLLWSAMFGLAQKLVSCMKPAKPKDLSL